MKSALTSGLPVDNRLAFLDQAAFLRLRATGFDSGAQSTWLYDRPVDMDGLRQFNRNLSRGLLGRRIERSPLAFGRHRWVECRDIPEIDIAATPRPREELSSWIDEPARSPVDPEYGPGWYLRVVNFEDGGSAVTMVASHTLVDGIGFVLSICAAAKGEVRDLGYPQPRSRTRPRALLVDGRDTVRGLPEVFGAIGASAALAIKRGRETASQPASPRLPQPPPRPDEDIVLPVTRIFLDSPSWKARASELGGTTYSLIVAFAAKLAELFGRVSSADGNVVIAMPVSERTPDDTRGNALTGVTFRINPTDVTTDLRTVRNEIKQGVAALKQTPNELLKPLPLTPMTPKWLARRVEGLALGTADLPVGCSHLGDLDPAVLRIDGTDADICFMRSTNEGVSRQRVERAAGELYMVSGEVNGKMFIDISAYQPNAENSNKHLRDLAEQALSAFQLTPAAVV